MKSNNELSVPGDKPSDQTLTIVHVIFQFTIGGMEKVMIECIRDLTPEFKHVVVSLKTASEEHINLLPEGVVVHSLEKREGNDWKAWLKMWRLLRSVRADVLHTYNLGTLEYQLMGLFSGVPLRVHAEHGRDASDPFGITPRYVVFRKIMRVLVHRWIAVSKDLASWLDVKIGVPIAKIDLIHNGVKIYGEKVDSEHDRAAVSGWPQQLAGPGCFIIGTVGRLDAVKNQKALIGAFSKILEKIDCLSESVAGGATQPRIGLVIVGGGTLYEELLEQVDLLGLSEYIWLTGPRYDVNDILPCFDLFVLPSLAEGIPMTLLEAMSMSVPVVASAVGGVPELVTKDCGLLLEGESTSKFENELVDAILDCFTNRSQAAVRARAARHRVESQFSQCKMSRQYAAVYNRVGM